MPRIDFPTADLLGVRFHQVTRQEALRVAHQWISERAPRYAVTPNPEIVVAAQKDADLRTALNQAHLSLPDGVALFWAAKRLGVPLVEKITGIDFAEALLKQESAHQPSLFLLGSKPGVALKAAAQLQKLIPGITIVGTYHGYFAESDRDRVVQIIRDTQPSILFVGLGFPRQERFLAENHEVLGVPFSMAVGGTFDVWSGQTRRAPRLFRKLGIEWIYRLLREPWRWQRQRALLTFIRLVIMHST